MEDAVVPQTDAGTGTATDAFGSQDQVREKMAHSEVAETPQERLGKAATAKAQAQNALQSVSSQGTKDLGDVQQSLQELIQLLDLPQEEADAIFKNIETDWQQAYDTISTKIEEVEQIEQALQSQIQQEQATPQAQVPPTAPDVVTSQAQPAQATQVQPQTPLQPVPQPMPQSGPKTSPAEEVSQDPGAEISQEAQAPQEPQKPPQQ